ncbi:hypothetical protein MRB53_040270 [Persea americana]|nr:hypothetical protein MRB53_040270 [Persea americana]
MATRAAHKRLTKEYANLQANPVQYITAHPSEDNILVWHYILTGPEDTPYTGGQYWGTLVFPSDYPFATTSHSNAHSISEEMTTGSISASAAERRSFASMTRWWNSTGGGSTKRLLNSQRSSETTSEQSNSSSKGFGAIKAGDGGVQFKEQFPELDEQNWKWMEEQQIDPRNGLAISAQRSQQNCAPDTAALGRRTGASQGVVGGAREARNAGQGWLSRNKWLIIGCGLFAYVLVARVMSDQAKQ